jgi:hypothetical protein
MLMNALLVRPTVVQLLLAKTLTVLSLANVLPVTLAVDMAQTVVLPHQLMLQAILLLLLVQLVIQVL